MVTPATGARVRLVSLGWALVACGIAAGGLFERLLADDAYYYFEVARNAARGEGLTFDSIAPTNGFHPLWAWLLVPVYALFPDSLWLPVRIALALSALCVPVAAIGIHGLFARLGAPRSGELAAYAWLFNPFTVVLAFRGVEAPLASLLLLLSIAWLVRVRNTGRYSLRECAVLGATLGACFLARTDAVLWAAIVAAFLARDLVAAGRLREIASRGLVAGAVACLVALPWIAWNLRTFGTVVQTSVDAKLMFDLYGRLPPLLPPDTGALAALAELPLGAVRNLLLALLVDFRFAAGEEWSELRRGAVLFWLAVGWALVVGALAVRVRRRPPDDPIRARGGAIARCVAVPLALLVILHLAVYALALRFYYSWYLLPPALALCLIHGSAFVAAEVLPARRYAAVAAGYAAALAAVAAVFCGPLFGRWPPERERALVDLGARLPSGTRASLWNAGEVGYFFSLRFPDVRVLNLDGLVNNELMRLARQDRYEEYLLRNVDVLLETPEPYLGQVVGAERAERFMRRHVRAAGDPDGRPIFEVVR